MTNIAYQNKDIASKVTSEALIGQSLAPFGLPHLKVKAILPTNLPLIEVNELRLDNLFLLEDDSVAIIDYESDYEKANFVKYINYAARVIRRYALSKRLNTLKHLRIIVIYTADVTSACEIYDLSGITVRIEAAYLINLDTDHIYQHIRQKLLCGEALTDSERLQLMILPLTAKGPGPKRDAAIKAVGLARQIPDRRQTIEVLAGILTFTDKVIDESFRSNIKEELRMTQIGKMIFDDGFNDGQGSKLIQLICKKIKKQKTPETIAMELEEELDTVRSVCSAAAAFAPDYEYSKVFEAWKQQNQARPQTGQCKPCPPAHPGTFPA